MGSMQNTSLSLALDFQENYTQKVAQAAEFIKQYLNKEIPLFSIVLGSGLGDISKQIKVKKILPYEDIPNFPESTVVGHEGQLIIGKINGVLIIGLKGRKHYYEVADEPFNVGILKTVFAVHVMAELGVKNYFVTNAAGGLNLDYNVGDLMIINSHINLLPNPLLGRHYPFTRVNDGQTTYRFQPMHDAYSKDLIKVFKEANEEFKSYLHEGSYLAVTGPTYETQAESLAFRDGLLCDAVGMSTTPEVIIAKNRGMNIIGLSCITNKIGKDGINATNHEEVKAILDSEEVRNRTSKIITNFFAKI